MRLHTVSDPGSGGMSSHTVLVPHGWQVEGSAWWPSQQLFNVLPSCDIRITSPEGAFVRIGPSVAATDYRPSQYALQVGARRAPDGSADNGYPVLTMPDTLEDWRSWLEQSALPTEYPALTAISVANVAEVPELTALLDRQIEPLRRQQEADNRQWAAMGGGVRGFAGARMLAVEWEFRLQGVPHEGLIMLGTTWFGSDMQVGRQLWWSVEPAVTFAAPSGRLEPVLPTLMAIASSVRPTPQWLKMKTDHMRALNRIAAEGAAQRAGIVAEASREVSRILAEGWEARTASSDGSHARLINSIREVETFGGSGGESVQLPSGYDHVYSNGGGEYLLTNDALFDPNIDPMFNSSNWSQMQILE